MAARATRYMSEKRTRYLEPRHPVYEPVTGEWCIAAWRHDGVYYKGQIIETLESGNYRVFFPRYGEGEVAWRQVFKKLV